MSKERNQKPKMGRPVVVGEDVVVMSVRLPRTADKAIAEFSRRTGQRKSEWIRSVVLNAIQLA